MGREEAGVIAHPKVFISHASEDKERFVTTFATKLRSDGVEAWVDDWELYPGDKLIQKIFDEGIGHADAVIVVISQFSVNKPWVREELDAAAVRRINDQTRLIPIILDATPVPVVLQATLWTNIADTNEYENAYQRIIATIFNQRQKPSLGNPPAYTGTEATIPGLSSIDITILRLFGEGAMEKDSLLGIKTEERWSAAQRFDIGRDDFLDATEILVNHGYLKPSEVVARIPPYFTLTMGGFETYLKTFDPSYSATFRDIAAAVVNQNLRENRALAETLGKPLIIVDHALRVMEAKRFITCTRGMGRRVNILDINASLRRFLNQ